MPTDDTSSRVYREWWIKEAFIGAESGTRYPAHVVNARGYLDLKIGMTHVIEYSAFETLQREVESLRAELVAMTDARDMLQVEWQHEHTRKVDLDHERDALRSQLARKDERIEVLSHGWPAGDILKQQAQLSVLAAENQRLREALEHITGENEGDINCDVCNAARHSQGMDSHLYSVGLAVLTADAEGEK